MPYYAIINPSTLEIHGTYQSDASLFDGKDESWPHIIIPENMDVQAISCVHDDDNNLMIVEDENTKQILHTLRMKVVRDERNTRLQQSDWTMLSDVSLPEQKKQEWVAYRQALRDLPSLVVDPCNVVWPDAP
jgi:hypothetical protein